MGAIFGDRIGSTTALSRIGSRYNRTSELSRREFPYHRKGNVVQMVVVSIIWYQLCPLTFFGGFAFVAFNYEYHFEGQSGISNGIEIRNRLRIRLLIPCCSSCSSNFESHRLTYRGAFHSSNKGTFSKLNVPGEQITCHLFIHCTRKLKTGVILGGWDGSNFGRFISLADVQCCCQHILNLFFQPHYHNAL